MKTVTNISILPELVESVIKERREYFIACAGYEYIDGQEFWIWYVSKNLLELSNEEIHNPTPEKVDLAFQAYARYCEHYYRLRTLFSNHTDYRVCTFLLSDLAIEPGLKEGYKLFALINVYIERKIMQVKRPENILFVFNKFLGTNLKAISLEQNKYRKDNANYRATYKEANNLLEKYYTTILKK